MRSPGGRLRSNANDREASLLLSDALMRQARVSGRPALIRRAVDILGHFGAAVLSATIAFHAARLTWTAYRFNDLSDGLVPIPMWIPMSTVPLGFALLGLVVLRDGVRLVAGREVRSDVSERDEAVSLAVDPVERDVP